MIYFEVLSKKDSRNNMLRELFYLLHRIVTFHILTKLRTDKELFQRSRAPAPFQT